jgi:Transmembrane domain of unknown function (DUF3566)
LPPVVGDARAGGNGFNGHDEAGLPPAGNRLGIERRDDESEPAGRTVDPGGDQTGAPAEPAWAAPAAIGPDAVELGDGERDGAVAPEEGGDVWPVEAPPRWSAGSPSSTAQVSAAAAAAALTAPRPGVDPDAEAGGFGSAEEAVPGTEAVGGLRQRVRPRRARKPKAQRGLRVRQRLWSIDPWSVFKLSALFYICVCGIILVAGTLLWNVGRSVGTIDDLESFVTRMGAYGTCTLKAEVPAGTEFEEDDDCADGEVLVGGYKFDDGTIFRIAGIGGGILVVAGSIGNVLMVVLLNLLNELTGGLRYTVVKEPLPRPQGGRQREPRFAAARGIARRSEPRHAKTREGPETAPQDDAGDGHEPIRVPSAELSTDPGLQR